MHFPSIALSALAALLPLALAVDNAGDLTAYTKRELVARDRLFAALTPDVRADLERRHPSEYDLNLEMFMDREEGDSDELVRRDDPQGPGDTHCTNGNVAMTYDDGPYTYNRELTDMWYNAGHRITYFINVQNFRCSYNSPLAEDLQYAVSKGMVVASHTGTHAHLEQLTTAQIDEQVQLVETYTYKTLGLVPSLIRPPYGESNAKIAAHLKSKWGLRSVMWAIDSGDALGQTPDQSVATIKAVKKGSTDIILNHEVKEPSAHQVAPRIIKYFKAKNIKSSGMGKCLGQKSYKVKLNTVPKRDASWNCKGVPAPGKSS